MTLPEPNRIWSRRQLLATLAAATPIVSFGSHAQGDPRREQYSRRVFPETPNPYLKGIQHEVWTANPATGPGPDVIVLHELSGASDLFFSYTDTLVAAGFTVHCPVMFGSAFGRSTMARTTLAYFQVCRPSSEFECNELSAESDINPWLTALAADIAQQNQRSLGVIGMCLTGIQPLAMLRCRAVVAPVLCQPTLPMYRESPFLEDFGLPAADMDLALTRVQLEDLEILLIRYEDDAISSAPRAARLRQLFGPHLQFVAVPGSDHSTLVHDHRPETRKAVKEFLNAHLKRN